MSETRALRAQLEETQAELRRAREHLEKLRAHHARERESLRQELEAARSEVAGLRDRLKSMRSGEGEEPLLPSGDVLASPALGQRSEEASTALVALARAPSPVEAALPALSRLLKLSPVDVRFRLAPLLPAVMARLPLAQAQELRAALRAEGFLAVSCEVAPRAVAGWVTVKRFALEEQDLSVEAASGERTRVGYAELRLLMKGRRSFTQVETKDEVEIQYEGRNFGRRVHKTVEEKSEHVESFLWVLGKGFRAAFTQSTQFMGLGELRAYTVTENLQRLMEELLRRAPHVEVDERLMQVPGFAMPLVESGRSQELLAELVFRALEEGLWT